MILTGEQVKFIKASKPNLSFCQARVINGELFILGLAPVAIKTLLTKAQTLALISGMARFNAKLFVKNVLILRHALIKATIILCKPTKRCDNAKARSKKLTLARQQIDSLTNISIG
ncbi:SsrA-binding protein [Candidatus Hodgkinia cicadicola]|nr:SsrA-binding protein [Candidatus Hodgkinia cicadicola]